MKPIKLLRANNSRGLLLCVKAKLQHKIMVFSLYDFCVLV